MASNSEDLIKVEDVANKSPGSVFPLATQTSPCEELLTFLYTAPGSNVHQLFYVDLTKERDAQVSLFASMPGADSQDVTVSAEEKQRRERMRLFTEGMMTYKWNGTNKDNQRVVVPYGNKVLTATVGGQYSVLYDGSAGHGMDPRLSPDGNNLALVINKDLYFKNVGLNTGADASPEASLVRLTTNGGEPDICCGLADYVAQEEMDRYEGFWWSPSSKYIAYTETNDSEVPNFRIHHQGIDDPVHYEVIRYPFAGQKNPVVKLAVVDLSEVDSSGNGTAADAKSVWMNVVVDDTKIDPNDYYLGRIGWWPDDTVMAQVQNRTQTLLQILRIDPTTGESSILFEETSKHWINLHDMLHCFPLGWSPKALASSTTASDFFFLWASERSGFRKIYMYKFDSTTQTCSVQFDGKSLFGDDDWVVESITYVDNENEMVYATGNGGGDPTQKHLFTCDFSALDSAPGGCNKVSIEEGWHMSTVSGKLGMVVDVFSSLTHFPSMALHRYVKEGKEIIGVEPLVYLIEPKRSLLSARDALLGEKLSSPRMDKIRSKDDKVDLYCAAYVPDESKFGPGPYPCIVSVYGGPHVQRVAKMWTVTADMRAQRFAQCGYIVIKCDNRGSSRRGIEFEGAIGKNMGDLELEDQKAAIDFYAAEGLVDVKNVGMVGWSYGGYMSAMAVCRASETFKCAIAGAPVTSWDAYDTHYTERYMGLPQENTAGYESSNVMTHVNKMQGRLLLIHGLIDENVHFRHTARLINKLISGKYFFLRLPYGIYTFTFYICESDSHSYTLFHLPVPSQ